MGPIGSKRKTVLLEHAIVRINTQRVPEADPQRLSVQTIDCPVRIADCCSTNGEFV